MKQMKLLLVALMTVLMGMSVTSCMKGDENTIYTGPTFAKCVDIFPATFEQGNGQKLVSKDLLTSTLNTGEIYFFYFQFDTAVQDATSPSITVTLPGEPLSISAKYSEGPTAASSSIQGNAPLRSFKESFYLFNAVPLDGSPFMLGKDHLIIPIVYWVKVEATDDKQKEEFNKHSFILTYDDIKSGDTTLNLTLHHVINDGSAENVNRDRFTSSCKAYNMVSVMSEFQSKAGNKPTKLKVKVKTNSSKDSLDGAVEKEWEYTIKE